jgi:hypothetical protein
VPTKPRLLVNENMATGDAPIKVDPGTVQILKPPAKRALRQLGIGYGAAVATYLMGPASGATVS